MLVPWNSIQEKARYGPGAETRIPVWNVTFRALLKLQVQMLSEQKDTDSGEESGQEIQNTSHWTY